MKLLVSLLAITIFGGFIFASIMLSKRLGKRFMYVGMIPMFALAVVGVAVGYELLTDYETRCKIISEEIVELDAEIMTRFDRIRDLNIELDNLDHNTSNLNKLRNISVDIRTEKNLLNMAEDKRFNLITKRANLSPVDEYVVWR